MRIEDPEKVEFANCILTILMDEIFLGMECNRVYLVEKEVTTLKDISDDYPDVKLVIVEGPYSGKIYKYGNHKANEWEEVGTMEGYA